MNKQTWENLSLESQIKWWDFNSPPDATHTASGRFYKCLDDVWKVCSEDYPTWNTTHHTVEWLEDNLIPKPVKAYTPKAVEKPEAFIPKVGEECEFSSVGHHSGFMWCIFRGVMSDGSFIVEYHRNTSQDRVTCDAFNSLTTVFRPIITERDTRAVELYRMFHNDGLQDREIMQSDKFDTYLRMFDILVMLQRGDV